MGWSRGGVDKRFEINSDMDIIVVVGLYMLILVYLYTETVYVSPSVFGQSKVIRFHYSRKLYFCSSILICD